MQSRHYIFFDIALEMTLPADVLSQWDALYGAFAGSPRTAQCSLHIAWIARSEETGVLQVGPVAREIHRSRMLLHVQDIVQNHVLRSVRSHLLWHGAAWRVGERGLVILGESGLGKTALSLAEAVGGGCVLSDEIAAWHPEREGLVPFPRAMAVRPDTLSLLSLDDRYPRICLDEEKAVAPMVSAESAARGDAVPIQAVFFLEWPSDDDAQTHPHVCELCVQAPDERWRRRMEREGVDVVPHPDGGNWWRCCSKDRIRGDDIREALEKGTAVLSGFHRGARRAPSFAGDPEIRPITEHAAEMSLSYLINGHTWAEARTASHLLMAAKNALRGACCASCVPGELERTRQAIRAAIL